MPTLSQAAPDMNGSPAAGVYLTNGIFLYRVAGLLADADDGLVELEDCYLLDVVHVPITELGQLCMRLVTPAGTDDGGGSVRAVGDGAQILPVDGARR
jgi:hypothetical protein